MEYVLAIFMIQAVSSLLVLVGVVISWVREKPLNTNEAERAMMRSSSWPTESVNPDSNPQGADSKRALESL